MLSVLLISLFESIRAGCATGRCGPNVVGFSESTPSEVCEYDYSLPFNASTLPFNASTVYQNFYGTDVSSACTGALLPPISVNSVDYLKNGKLISRYRKCIKKLCCKGDFECLPPFVICTKKSLCSCLTKEQFVCAVLSTIRIIAGKRCLNVPEMTECIVENIYCAAVESGATVEQLINFTSIALHNVYMFTYFPRPNICNSNIGCTTRGLLQLLSLNAYEKITSVSEINYVQKPYLLDTFSSVSIHDEFRVFMRFYNNDELTGLDSFISSVHLLQSQEAPLVNIKSAIEVQNGTYRPQNILEERVLNRFNIYYVLSSQIFYCKPAASSSVVFEY